jgi:Ca2+-binding RTX toxin-like protein
MAVITGTSARNTLRGTTGIDTIDGLDGNDLIYAGSGNDVVDGGLGADRIYGDAGNDTLHGFSGGDSIYGGLGDDELLGEDNNDILMGGFGADELDGGSGNDVLNGGYGSDDLIGGLGTDTVSYAVSDVKSGVIIDLASGFGFEGDAEGDSYLSIENATGSGFDDEIYGSAGANVLNGMAGNDYIVDGGGKDYVYGGYGSDWIVATQGVNGDYYDGGDNTQDTLDLSGWTSAISVNLAAKTLTNGAHVDKVINFERVIGTDYADTMTGTARAERLEGGDGADTLRSLAGFDRLVGGADADTFVYLSTDLYNTTTGWQGRDMILDFDITEDKLDISGLLTGITFSDISDVVTLTDNGVSTFLACRYTTANTTQYQFAMLLGVTGQTLADLDTAGIFITA